MNMRKFKTTGEFDNFKMLKNLVFSITNTIYQ